MSLSEESFKQFGFKQTLLKVFCSMIYSFQLKIYQNMKCVTDLSTPVNHQIHMLNFISFLFYYPCFLKYNSI